MELAVARWRTAGGRAQPGVRWRRDAWIAEFPDQSEALEELPDELDRGAVERVTTRLPETEAGVSMAFVICLAWGYGANGYGPHRALSVLAAENGSAPRRLLEAGKAVRAGGPLAGYEALAGSSRIHGLGPAFGTKFLFFQSRPPERALILDRLVAEWLDEHCSFVVSATRWSKRSYERYLRTMQDWAKAVGVEPETLEALLFSEQATVVGSQWSSAAGLTPTRVGLMGETVGGQIHQSDSRAQRDAESLVLAGVSSQLRVPLNQRVRIDLDGATVEVDGASSDEAVLVEVFARIGRLKGGQLHKVSTDTLKLVALGETRPEARLILAFADQEAADSVVGWRAALLDRRKIDKLVVPLDAEQRAVILAAQERQRMVNASPDEE